MTTLAPNRFWTSTRAPTFVVDLLRWVWRDRSFRAALFTFTLTRAVIFTIFVLATHITVIDPNRVFGRDAQDIGISMVETSVARRLRTLTHRGDTGWYLGIAINGYERQQFNDTSPHNWAFFPLFPLTWRAAATLTGGYDLTGMALCNGFLLVALILLHKTALAFGHNEATADRAVFYLVAFPTSYFFSLPFTESLFLLLTVGSFLAAGRGSWWLAGGVGALATATRFNGIILFPTLLLLYWQQQPRPRVNVLGIFLVPAGLLCYMLYLFSITGNALAFKDVQIAWARRPGFFLQPLFSYLANPLEISQGWEFHLLNFTAAVLALTCGAILLKRRRWVFAFYTLASIILPLSSSTLVSTARYAVVIFPIFFVLAEAGRAARVDQIIRTVLIVGLSLMAALYALGVTISYT